MFFIKYLKEFFSNIKIPIIVLDKNLRIIYCNESFFTSFKINTKINQNISFYKFNNNQWNIQKLKNLLEKVLTKKEKIENVKFTHDFETLGKKTLIINIKKIQNEENKSDYIMLQIEDITENNYIEKTFYRLEDKFKKINKISELFREYNDDNTYRKVLEIILEILDSKNCLFGHVNDENEIACTFMRNTIWHGFHEKNNTIIFSRKLWDSTFGRNQIKNKEFYSKNPLSLNDVSIPIYNSLSVPIVYKNKDIGCLLVANKTSNYSILDKNLLKAIANYISPLLHAKKLESHGKENQHGIFTKKFKTSKNCKENGITEIDHMDKQILHELCKNGKISLQDLSEKIYKLDGELMSNTGIKNRIIKLIDSEILNIQGNINIQKLNYQIAFLLIELKRYEDIEKYKQLQSNCPRTILLAKITGRYHLILSLVGRNLEDINDCINNCELIRKNDIDIKNSEFLFASKIIIPKYIPLDFFRNLGLKSKCKKLRDEN
ncbi:MAG: GAF domain-containing protein [Promethearchaeota archaeon]